MTKLEQLAEKAKTAQRVYDKAKAESEAKPKVALENGEIRAYSDKQGFAWDCAADGESIVRHVAKTIESAFITLNKNKDSDMSKVMLAIEIMTELSKVAKSEQERD